MEVKCSLSTLIDMAMQCNHIILAVNVLGGFCRALGQKVFDPICQNWLMVINDESGLNWVEYQQN